MISAFNKIQHETTVDSHERGNSLSLDLSKEYHSFLKAIDVSYLDQKFSHYFKIESDRTFVEFSIKVFRNILHSWKRVLKSFLIIAFMLSSASAFASWSLKKEYGDTTIYVSPNSTRLTLSYRTTAPKEKKFSKELLNKLEKEKRELLTIIGIKNWKVTRSDIKKEKKNTHITFEGSYLDSSGKMTYFAEYHFYASTKKLQILLTNDNLKKLKKDSKESNILEFRTKYGF